MSDVAKVIVGELFGTMMLIMLGNCVVANVLLKNTKGNNSGWMVICSGWGLAVVMAAFLSGISNAHLNPAVTIGLAVAGKKDAFVGGYASIPLYIVFQMLGAMLGQMFVVAAYRMQYKNTEDSALILATFSTGPNDRKLLWNMVTEIIATFVLVMVVVGTVSIKNLVDSATISQIPGPLLVGLAVMVIGLAVGGPTGFAINPARDLGPRLVHAMLPLKNKGKSDWGYAAVPVVGPIIGACIAGGIIQMIGSF